MKCPKCGYSNVAQLYFYGHHFGEEDSGKDKQQFEAQGKSYCGKCSTVFQRKVVTEYHPMIVGGKE